MVKRITSTIAVYDDGTFKMEHYPYGESAQIMIGLIQQDAIWHSLHNLKDQLVKKKTEMRSKGFWVDGK